jgi:hypothetical protein
VNDWRTLVFETLSELQADRCLVGGSRLMQALERRTAAEEVDIRAHLRASKLSFSQFLGQFRPDIVVQLRGATDMLVGFPAAAEGPPISEPRSLREDVYRAFTRVDAQPYNYSKSRARFTQEQFTAEDAIPGPVITKQLLLDERAEFARTQPADVAAALLATLDDTQPLTAFQKTINEWNLPRQWRRFHLTKIMARLNAWAFEHRQPLLAAWLNKEPTYDVWPVRRVMDLVLAEMGDDEIRGLLVPVRAVEAALRKTNVPPPSR